MPTLAAETDFPYEILWFIPASIAVLVLIALGARFMKHRRARGLERFARGRGYSFAARDDDWINDRFLAHLRYGLQEPDRLDADLQYVESVAELIPAFVFEPEP